MADLYPYYAGYAFEWALDAVLDLAGPEDLVLDPWNGSGTTTQAASAVGRRSIGFDLNPVAVTIATARQLSADQGERLLEVAPVSRSLNQDEPLARWFELATARRLRNWVEGGGGPLLALAVMRVVRASTSHVVGSNPTWVRHPAPSLRTALTEIEVDTRVRDELRWLVNRIATSEPARCPATVKTGDAGQLPLEDSTVQLTLTSPPYLTRIDYGVAFARELDVLGLPHDDQNILRSHLMGTTRSRAREAPVAPPRWGKQLHCVLDAISRHPSKDAAGYYLKQKLQYFQDLERALREIARVTAPGGHLQMVVQDSFFKDVPLKLSELVPEMAQCFDFHLVSTTSHRVTRSLVTLNRGAQQYPKADVVEAVLLLRKEPS